MLLAHIAFQHGTQDFSKLCLLAYEESKHVVPVNIDVLFRTESAVFWIGPKEAIVVDDEIGTEFKTIRPVPPAVLYLTPDNPNLPGARAAIIKIGRPDDGPHQVFFKKDLDQPWIEWNPIKHIR